MSRTIDHILACGFLIAAVYADFDDQPDKAILLALVAIYFRIHPTGGSE